MTPITERLAEALRTASNAIGPCSADLPLVRQIASALAEYDRLRTHPAEGGEGRDAQYYEAGQKCPTCANGIIGRRDVQFFCPNCGWLGSNSGVKERVFAELETPPPQPVAPERGEAKAIAPAIDYVPHLAEIAKILADRGFHYAAMTIREVSQIIATPQPTPAPTFRNPTIEDARKAAELYDHHNAAYCCKTKEDAMRFALNAIGAKMEEAL